jgi:CubicO group peptidase (beta-lactamase class C family)
MAIQSNNPVMLSYKRRSICLKFILLSGFMLFFQASRSQDTAALSGLIEKHKKMFGGKVAVMVWKDTIVYQRAVGEDMTVNTQLPVGAAGAWLTVALTMNMVDQGKVSLDDRVGKYLPIYEKYAKAYLTIRHCLTNVTGLAGEKGGVEKFFQKSKYASLEEQVNSFASSREIEHNPGEAFNYNNIGTNIAGRVLEVAGKKTFDRLMLERIFRPLGMKKSTYSSETAVNPFGGGISTAADFIKFLAMLLNKGVGNNKQVLSASGVDEVMKIQTSVVIIPGMPGIYGHINKDKKYAFVVFGEVKDKKNDKSEAVYKEITTLLDNTF